MTCKNGDLKFSDTCTNLFLYRTQLGESTAITIDYGERWTQYRAILHDLISSKSVLSFHPLLEENARSASIFILCLTFFF